MISFYMFMCRIGHLRRHCAHDTGPLGSGGASGAGGGAGWFLRDRRDALGAMTCLHAGRAGSGSSGGGGGASAGASAGGAPGPPLAYGPKAGRLRRRCMSILPRSRSNNAPFRIERSTGTKFSFELQHFTKFTVSG